MHHSSSVLYQYVNLHSIGAEDLIMIYTVLMIVIAYRHCEMNADY